MYSFFVLFSLSSFNIIVLFMLHKEVKKGCKRTNKSFQTYLLCFSTNSEVSVFLLFFVYYHVYFSFHFLIPFICSEE